MCGPNAGKVPKMEFYKISYIGNRAVGTGTATGHVDIRTDRWMDRFDELNY